MLDFNKYKSILCLSGVLPGADFFQLDLPIIAADGATNQLMQMGVKPQIIIGDLDSVKPEYLDTIPAHYHFDQNYCDFEKSLMYLKNSNLLPTIIVGINGGVLDHVLNNINIFMQTNCLLYAPPVTGFVIRAQDVKLFKLPLNTKISLLGLAHAQISTQGLKWNLQKADLVFPGANSCFNRTVTEEIEIRIEAGNLLVLIYDAVASLEA